MIGPALCPICNQPLSSRDPHKNRFVPFCSRRCQEVDLLRWCNGKYAIVDPLTPDRLLEELSPEDLEEMLDQ